MKRKWSFGLSVVVLATLAFLAMPTWVAGKEKEKTGTCPAGELRWHGTLVRKSSDGSVLTVRKTGVEKEIHISSETKWTKMEKGEVVAADPSEVKEGSDVITCSKSGAKKEFEATHIDLRLPK